ncbi:MAG TPA: hypothetical protein VGC76_18905 [Pyrinomonadaceae bacterium]|jgi:hypothetical protein
MQNLNLKKFFLYLLISSVALSALLGIGVILFGNFSDFEIKILLTTFTVTCTSILGLACGAYLETKGGKILPAGGIGFALLSAILWIYLIWGSGGHEETIFKIAATSTLSAVACSLISLLSIARLEPRFIWSRYAAHISVWSLAAILVWLTWAEKNQPFELLPRVIGILSIIVAALTIVTPIFHFLGRQTPETEDIDAEIARLRRRIAELENRKAKFPAPETE